MAGHGWGDDESSTGPTADRVQSDRSSQGGVKLSLLVEGHGLPIGLADAGANRNDFKMGRATRDSIPIDRPQPTEEQPQHLCLDKGYDYDEVRELGKEFGYTLHIRPRNEEAQAIKRQVGYKARRWLVERTHSWMKRFRSLLIRLSRKRARTTWACFIWLVPGLHTEPRACWNRRKMPGLHVRENSFSCQYLMWKGTANPYRFACGAPQLPA
jgi:putative transposase